MGVVLKNYQKNYNLYEGCGRDRKAPKEKIVGFPIQLMKFSGKRTVSRQNSGKRSTEGASLFTDRRNSQVN